MSHFGNVFSFCPDSVKPLPSKLNLTLLSISKSHDSSSRLHMVFSLYGNYPFFSFCKGILACVYLLYLCIFVSFDVVFLFYFVSLFFFFFCLSICEFFIRESSLLWLECAIITLGCAQPHSYVSYTDVTLFVSTKKCSSNESSTSRDRISHRMAQTSCMIPNYEQSPSTNVAPVVMLLMLLFKIYFVLLQVFISIAVIVQ